MLVWGKTSKPRTSSNQYPDTEKEMIVTVPKVGEKGTARKFIFNLHAQTELMLHTTTEPGKTLNDKAIFSYDPENQVVYVGIYDAEAFADIEKSMGAEVPTMNIGKTTMSFSSKDLHEALQEQYKEEFDVNADSYFKLVPVELENAPITMYLLTPTSEKNKDEEETTEDAETEVPETDKAENTDSVQAPTVTPVGSTEDVNVH